jgi:GntR family transcriptional regulator
MRALGREPTARVIGKEIVAADATVATQLALTRVSPSLEFGACVGSLEDGIPLSFDETYLPLEISKKIISNNLKVEPTLVLAKHAKSFSLIDCLAVDVDRMQRNFEPIRSESNLPKPSLVTMTT